MSPDAPEPPQRVPTDGFGLTVREGDIIAGKYRVDRVLGAGGMGVVVQATHEVLNERVALKFLLPEVITHKDIVERFVREAKAAVRIKSDHVARILDVGKLETGAPYIVMEYLDGEDLSQVLKRELKLEPSRVVRLVLQACDAMASAHSSGIIHRDLKPANLFATRASDGSERLKVLDFGISKLQDEVSSLTRSSTAMGTPVYMAPEQLRNARGVDARADIWSLGVVAFELLTGSLPYAAENITELVALVLENEPPLLRSLCPELPVELEQTIARALSKNRDERYPSVAEFATDLARVADPADKVVAERVARILWTASDDLEPVESFPSTALAPTSVSTPPASDGPRALQTPRPESFHPTELASESFRPTERPPDSFRPTERPPESEPIPSTEAKPGVTSTAFGQTAGDSLATPNRRIRLIVTVAVLVGWAVLYSSIGGDDSVEAPSPAAEPVSPTEATAPGTGIAEPVPSVSPAEAPSVTPVIPSASAAGSAAPASSPAPPPPKPRWRPRKKKINIFDDRK